MKHIKNVVTLHELFVGVMGCLTLANERHSSFLVNVHKVGSILTRGTFFTEIIFLYICKQCKNDNIVNFVHDGKTRTDFLMRFATFESMCELHISGNLVLCIQKCFFKGNIIYWFSHWESRIRTTNQKSSTNAVSGLLLLGFITVVSVVKMMKIELTPRSESQTSLLKGRNILNMWTSRTYITVKRNITLPVWKSKIFEIVKYLSDSKLKTRHLVEFIWDDSRVIPEMNFTEVNEFRELWQNANIGMAIRVMHRCIAHLATNALLAVVIQSAFPLQTVGSTCIATHQQNRYQSTSRKRIFFTTAIGNVSIVRY